MTNSDKSYYGRLCRNILAGRFDWRKYCTPRHYFGREICVTPLHCSYGQIGYTIHFPYANSTELEYDWEISVLTIDDEDWREYLAGLEYNGSAAGRQLSTAELANDNTFMVSDAYHRYIPLSLPDIDPFHSGFHGQMRGSLQGMNHGHRDTGD